MKKKYLDHNRRMMKLPAEDDQDHKVDNGSKWVNTDSECEWSLIIFLSLIVSYINYICARTLIGAFWFWGGRGC